MFRKVIPSCSKRISRLGLLVVVGSIILSSSFSTCRKEEDNQNIPSDWTERPPDSTTGADTGPQPKKLDFFSLVPKAAPGGMTLGLSGFGIFCGSSYAKDSVELRRKGEEKAFVLTISRGCRFIDGIFTPPEMGNDVCGCNSKEEWFVPLRTFTKAGELPRDSSKDYSGCTAESFEEYESSDISGDLVLTLEYYTDAACTKAETVEVEFSVPQDIAPEPLPVVLIYYAHPCAGAAPDHQISCPSDGILQDVTDDPYLEGDPYPVCASIGASEGSACLRQEELCILKKAQVCSTEPDKRIIGGSYLYCRSEAFPPQAAICAISSRKFKNEVSYLTDAQKRTLAAEIAEVRLAKYNYRGGPVKKSLGLIIEDNPDLSFIYEDRQRVDLYSYISAVVAAVQLQQRKIEELEARIAVLSKDGPKPSFADMQKANK